MQHQNALDLIEHDLRLNPMAVPLISRNRVLGSPRRIDTELIAAKVQAGDMSWLWPLRRRFANARRLGQTLRHCEIAGLFLTLARDYVVHSANIRTIPNP